MNPAFAKSDLTRKPTNELLKEGAITESYGADREKVIEMLNAALATELVCVLRYRYHYQVAKEGIGLTIAHEFIEHSNEELEHADKIAERITQLGGKPDFSPNALLQKSHSLYGREGGDDLELLIKDDLVAERVAIETYTQVIRQLGDKDPTTRRLMEHILAQEEEHADELVSILKWYNAFRTGVMN